MIRTGCSSPVPVGFTFGIGAWTFGVGVWPVTSGRLALAHDAAGNLPDFMLDPATPVRPFVHSPLVGLNQEWRGIRTRRQPLPAPYLGETGIVLAGPVNVHPAGNTVPLLVRGLGATLRTLHAPTRFAAWAALSGAATPAYAPMLRGPIPHRFQHPAASRPALPRRSSSPTPGSNLLPIDGAGITKGEYAGNK
jgi:hypothetical protein